MLTPTSTPVVALYCRLSPRPDGSYEGVDRQEIWGRAYAARVWPGVPVEVFVDAGISAFKDDAIRPGFERLKKAVTAGRVNYLWAVEQYRVERGEMRWFMLADLLDSNGISELHTDRDGIVRVRDEVAGIKAVLGAGEARRTRRRVLDTISEKARQGEPGGALPYGFERGTLPNSSVNSRRPTKTYAIVEEQAAIIRESAQRALDGWSLLRIANDLKARGVRSTYGGPMTGSVIRRWLTNAAVAGMRRHHEQLYPGNWPAILDEDTWQTLRSILGGPRSVQCANGSTYQVGDQKKYRSTTAKRYLLTGGLAVCGVCGSALIGVTKIRVQTARGVTRRTSTPYLMCHSARGGKGCIGAQLLPVEDYVIEWLFAELDDPEFLARVSTDDGAERRAELTGALSAVESRRRELSGLWAVGTMNTTDWAAAREALDEREQDLRAELAAVPIAPPALDIAAVRELWPTEDLNLDERRAFIRRFVGKVTIDKGRPGLRRFDPDRVDILPRLTA